MKRYFGILFLVSSCTSAPLTQEEQAVRLLRKSDAPANCKEIGSVHAPGLASITEEGREKDLRRETHKVGGNVVSINRSDENGTLYGTAYNCP